LDRDDALVPHNARHLPQRLPRVREEHQPRLTEHDIERAIPKGQRRHIALPPLQIRAHAPRDREHGLVQVEPDHRTFLAQPVGRLTRHHPGPARHIEDPLTSRDPCSIQQVRNPVREQPRNERRLIRLGRINRETERLGQARNHLLVNPSGRRV
jgi:hypothetical protein